LPDKLLVVVAGPTASGKTQLSMSIANHFKTVVVSADSRQFYREIPIGTAQPSAAELHAVPHHFIAHLSIRESLSAGEYAAQCLALLKELCKTHQVVVLTGGSGLYIDAVLFGIDSFPESDPAFRTELNRMYLEKGIEALREELKASDQVYYDQVDLQNPRRIIRALEVCRATGKPYSSFLGKDATPLPWKYLMVGYNWPRDVLYDRINQRVDAMITAGLEQEAAAVHPYSNLNALHTVGYSELFDFFDGLISRETAVDKIKQNSRNYAKRQLTWCRRHQEMIWFEPGAESAVIAGIESELNKN
jgi:tRNA dimethylallyltransferase